GRGRRDADTQERQSGFGDDGHGQVYGGDDQHGPQYIGQDVAPQDGERAHADQARGLHVFFVALDHGGAAYRAGILNPPRYSDGEDKHIQGKAVMGIARQQTARNAVDQQRDEDGGEGKLDIGNTHDDAVDAAAGIAADQAQRDADHQREHDGGQAHQQGDARAIQDGGQHVAALVVGAQQEPWIAIDRPGGRDIGVQQVEGGQVEGVVGGYQGREQRTQADQQCNDRRDDGRGRTAEAVENVAVIGA